MLVMEAFARERKPDTERLWLKQPVRVCSFVELTTIWTSKFGPLTYF